MAADGLTLNKEQLDGLLQCPVCLDQFKGPRVLPCQHTFCWRPCLLRLITGNTVKCPQCRAFHQQPLTGFPRNIVIGMLLEQTARRDGTDGEQHGVVDLTNDEPAAPIANLSTGQAATSDSSSTQSHCSLCANEQTSQCPGHCSAIFCSECLPLHHVAVVNDLTTLRETLVEQLHRVTQQEATLQDILTHSREEVDEFRARLTNMVTQRASHMLSSVAQHGRALGEPLDAWREAIEVTIATIDSLWHSPLNAPLPTSPIRESAERRTVLDQHESLVERPIQMTGDSSVFQHAVRQVNVQLPSSEDFFHTIFDSPRLVRFRGRTNAENPFESAQAGRRHRGTLATDPDILNLIGGDDGLSLSPVAATREAYSAYRDHSRYSNDMNEANSMMREAARAIHSVFSMAHDDNESNLVGPLEGLRLPRDVAIGPGGTIYIADSVRKGILIFSPSESPRFLPVEGNGSTVCSVAVSADAHLYVADYGLNTLYKAAPGVADLTAVDGEFARLTGLAISGSQLFVADTFNERIQVFDIPTGEHIRDHDLDIAPHRVAVAPRGHYAVTERNGLQLFNADNSAYNWTKRTFNWPKGLAFNSRDELLVVDGGLLRIFSLHGDDISQWSLPSTSIEGIAVESDDIIWAADAGRHTVYRLVLNPSA